MQGHTAVNSQHVEWPRDVLDQAISCFKNVDTSGNGRVSQQEIFIYYAQWEPSLEADLHNDGKITFDEWLTLLKHQVPIGHSMTGNVDLFFSPRLLR